MTVTGTSAPGNTVYVAATNTDNTATTTARRRPPRDGTFSVAVPIDGGTTVLNAVAVSPTGGTAHDQRSIVFDFVPGTLVLDAADPNNDDHGPGNYAYPRSSNFHAGAFDMQRLPGLGLGLRRHLPRADRDLTPTSGRPLGAQLVDVYVHEPGARRRRPRAANASRNFQIAPAFAWSRLLQVQGFGQRYEDAAGNTVGTIAISANPIRATSRSGFRRRASAGLPAPAGRSPSSSTARMGSQQRPGARLRADSSGLPVRCLCGREQRPALHRQPGLRSEGKRRAHAARRPRSRTSSTTRCTTRLSCRG